MKVPGSVLGHLISRRAFDQGSAVVVGHHVGGMQRQGVVRRQSDVGWDRWQVPLVNLLERMPVSVLKHHPTRIDVLH